MAQEYKVVSSNSVEHLTEQVNTFLEMGWTVQGSIQVGESTFYKYHQTLVREKPVGESNSKSGKQLLNG